LSGSTPPRHGTHVLVARSDITTAILALGGAKAGDTDARCGQGVRSGSILLRICYPYVAAGLSNKSNSKLHAPSNFHLRCWHQ
jgi:hypothetical protein